MKCAQCKKSLSAYEVKAKKIWYYKCPTVVCSSNESETLIQSRFIELLSQFKVEDQYIDKVKVRLNSKVNEYFQDEKETLKNSKSKLTQISNRIDKIELKFIDGEIDSEIYKKHKKRFDGERLRILKEISKIETQVSNPSDIVDFGINICQNIAEMWRIADNKVKRKVQELVFPNGVEYSKSDGIYRTNKINTIIGLIASFRESYNKKADQVLMTQSACSSIVVRRGLYFYIHK